jgi:hypothetical protein
VAEVPTKQAITRKLGVPVERAWAAIAEVGHLDEWFPAIATCTVRGTGVGARREMTLDGGLGAMVDVVLSIDEEARTLRYERIESPFPVSSYVGTVEVMRSYDGLAVVVWTVDLTSQADVAEGVAGLLADAIGAGVEGMGAALSR